MGEVGAERRERSGDAAVLALTILPLVVSAVALVVAVGGDYRPVADHALTELQTRDVGRHPVLVGLYSRADWNHPGPALFYLLAPFYRLAGSASIGMYLGALAINGVSIAGIAFVARRLGGTPLLLCSLLGCALLMRTLGAEFLSDPWNCFVTVLPFGLMVFLTWAVTCGQVWALPVAAGVASFLAQTHVGFLVLAVPLLIWGTAWLVVPRLRSDAPPEERRALVRPVLASAGVAAVLWLPVGLDFLLHAPSNAQKVFKWFKEGEGGAHSLAEGWRVVSGQFGWPPEWLTREQGQSYTGESPFLPSSPWPWLLLLLAAAAVGLWRWGRAEDRQLVLVVGLTLTLGIVAVARTLGPVFYYRLRWTWIGPMVAFVVVAWAAWQLAARKGPPALARLLAPVAVAGLVVLTGVNTYTAATAGTPQGWDTGVIDDLMPDVMAAVDDVDGPVLVTDPFQGAAWYARGIVLQLERRGIDVRVTRDREVLYGAHRVVGDEPAEAVLVVVMDDGIAPLEDDPDLRLVARWRQPFTRSQVQDRQRMAELEAANAAGELTDEELLREATELNLSAQVEGVARDVAVFLDEAPT